MHLKAFRCAYCLFYNEARKTKLTVPKLTNIEVNPDESSSSTMSSNSLDDLNNLSDPVSLPSSSLSVTDNISKPRPSNEKIKSEKNRKGSMGDILSNKNEVIYGKKTSKSTEKLVNFENFDSNKENLLNVNNFKKESKKIRSESIEAVRK